MIKSKFILGGLSGLPPRTPSPRDRRLQICLGAQVDKTELPAKKIDNSFAKAKAAILSDPSIKAVSDDNTSGA
jgi:hypothetical protein